MRELVTMWRDRRLVGLVLFVAVVYLAVLLPFKQLELLPGFSTIRPANALPVVFGLLFGPAAAWGSALGNVLGDLLGGTWSAGSYFGAIGNFLTAYIAYRLWGNLGRLSSNLEPDMSTGDVFPEYVVVSFIAGCVTAAVIGWGHEIVGLVSFPVIALTIVFNNTIAELFLGPPLLYILYPRVRERGLLYHQLLDDRSLPSANRFRVPAAVGVIVVSVAWIFGGTLYGVVEDSISLGTVVAGSGTQAVGSTIQVYGGAAMFGLLTVASGLTGERLSRLDLAGRRTDSDPAADSGDIGVLAIAGLGVTGALLYAGAFLMRVIGTNVPTFALGSQLAIGLILPTILVGSAWWLASTGVESSRSWRLTLWSFGGLGIVTVLSAWQFYHVLLGIPATGAVIEGFLLNVQAGAVGGLIVGIYATRATRHAEALANQRDNLQRENERLEEFAHAVSHDLRSPLSVAMGNLEIVRDREDDERLADVARAHDRMATLIDDLRTLARQGEVVTDPEAISLANAVEVAWISVSTDAATLDIDTEHTIHADIGRVQQLLENLLRNAVIHGGDDVTITAGDLPDGFYIEDDGPGIPPEQREKVFQTGYTTGDGTGFGLSIVARIAEAHGWHTTITDGTDGGTRIEIRGVTVVDA